MTDTGFNWRQFIKCIAAIAIPVALQNLLSTTGSMVDTMMIAPLGETTVGAIGLCAQFSSLMFSCYWGFVGGGILFFSQYFGAKDERGIERSYGITYVCLMTVAVIFCVLATTNPELIMRLYTDKPAIQEIGVEYLRIVGFAYPMSVWAVGAGALLRATGKVRIPLVASIASLIVNVSFNYVLINGKLGFPKMGVRGAAAATVISAFVNLVVVYIAARASGYKYLFAIRNHFNWSKDKIGEYFRKCLPIICNELFYGIGYMIINVVLGRQAEEAIAANAVYQTIQGLVISFFAGFSNASAITVGNDVGAGRLDDAYEKAKRLVYLCGGVILIVCLGIFAFHSPLLHALSLSGESYEICTGMLMVYTCMAVIRMMNWQQNDTYRSAGDAAFGTILEIVFLYVMVLPCVCVTGLVLHSDFLIIFALCFVDEPIRFTLMQIHMYSGKWIKPVTPQGRESLAAFMEKRGHKTK